MKGIYGLRGKWARVFDWTKLFIVGVIIAAALSCGAEAAQTRGRNYIGSERAKAIALAHAGVRAEDAVVLKSRVDHEDGRVVYDVEFYSGDTEYDYEIDAITGEIIEVDRDIENYRIPDRNENSRRRGDRDRHDRPRPEESEYLITRDQAKFIALSDAGVPESKARGVRIRLERERGRMVYDVEFRSGRTEYEYEIDAEYGDILSAEYDDFD